MRSSSFPTSTMLLVIFLAAGSEIQAFLTPLEARQTPATTTSTACPDNDGLFYVSDYGYTYQLQCGTTYVGTILEDLQTTPGFSSCIEQCTDYNYKQIASSTYCLAVTFNAPDENSVGDCSLYSDILTVNVAAEEGLVEDSALLISGNGQQFATPQPESSQVLVLPDPASITTSTAPYTTKSLASTSQNESPVTESPTDMMPTSVAWGDQETMTSIVPFTQVAIIPVVECSWPETNAAGESSCTTLSTETSTVTGYRTEISCTPGGCVGVMTATGTVPGLEETGTCIVP